MVASAAMPAPAPLEPEYEDGDDGDDAVHLKRRPWAAEEDEHLVLLVEEHGVKAWAKIAQFLHMRNGKQCRERYRNHLRPELCKGEWSVEEDTEIWNRVREVGTKWAAISELFMPTRTDNDIKNRWNSIIRKPKAPGGREWTHQETEQRMAFIGNAARTQVPCRPPARRYPARRRRRAAGPARPPAGPTHHATPPLTRRAACPSQERKRERQRTQEEKRKTQQPKSKHQPRAAHADGAMDDGESPSRGRRLFRSPNAGSPSGGALAEGALGASAPNSESLRRYFGEAAGDSVGTPAPVTAAAVGAAASPAGSAASLLRAAAARAASIMGSPCSFLGSPGTFEISAETFDVGAALGGVGETLVDGLAAAGIVSPAVPVAEPMVADSSPLAPPSGNGGPGADASPSHLGSWFMELGRSPRPRAN